MSLAEDISRKVHAIHLPQHPVKLLDCVSGFRLCHDLLEVLATRLPVESRQLANFVILFALFDFGNGHAAVWAGHHDVSDLDERREVGDEGH